MNDKPFIERLNLIRGTESARAFAIRAGVKPTTMSGYLTGKNEPTRPAMIALATAGGVSVHWLATGKGPMRPEAPGLRSSETSSYRPQPTIDEELLARISEGIATVYKEANARISAADQGRLVARIINELLDAYESPSERLVGLKLALTRLRDDLRKVAGSSAASGKHSA